MEDERVMQEGGDMTHLGAAKNCGMNWMVQNEDRMQAK
jgi:hypothetical protein